MLHNFFSATVSTYWQTAANNFTQTGNIRHDVEYFLSTTVGCTETADYFVKD